MTKVCLRLENTEKLCLMTLKTDAKFEGKPTCASKNDMRNLGTFHKCTRNSENWYFDGILLSKVKNVQA